MQDSLGCEQIKSVMTGQNQHNSIEAVRTGQSRQNSTVLDSLILQRAAVAGMVFGETCPNGLPVVVECSCGRLVL